MSEDKKAHGRRGPNRGVVLDSVSQGYWLLYHTVFALGEEEVEVVVCLGGEGKHSRQYAVVLSTTIAFR